MRWFALAAATLAAAGLGFGATPVAAADLATFGAPSIRSTFGTEIVFEQPVTTNQALGSVELLATFADAIGPTVIPVPAPSGTGTLTLAYTMPTSGAAHILPNTPIAAAWRVRPSGGGPSTIQVSPTARYVYGDERFDWKTKVGPLMRVHWTDGDDAFGARALKIGEDAIASTSKLLGVSEKDPVDFYVYGDQNAFYDALGPGTRENVGGQANAEIRTLFALIEPSQIDDPWVGVVIPHELTHLVFDTAVHNPYHFPPRWLNEGLAVYVSAGFTSSDRRDVEGAVGNDDLIPLTGLTAQFPTSASGFSLAYSESVSAVDHFVRTYTQDALVGLVRSYADGRTDDEAFDAAIGLDMAGFSDAWLAALRAKVPERLGPQPAPAGPVPSDWVGGGDGSVTPTARPTTGPDTASATPGTVPAISGRDTAADGTVLLVIVGAITLVGLVVVALRRTRRAA